MTSCKLWGRIVGVLAVLFLVGGGVAFAQLQTGNLYGTVVDEQGSALPGVTVTLSGQGAPQVQVTDAKGAFRFLNLSPASYQLKAELEGFSTIEYPNVAINVGRNTQIEVTLSAAVEDVITVLGETPLLDERRISTGATISNSELEKIPTARDPWAVLQTTPGVLTDRINVGGNESGQQSTYVGPGSSGDQAIWAVDGVVITDMAALGSSPAYYDFDAFEEMQVTTGGSDSTIATGGVVLNIVTKRGTNEWRGTGRYYKSDKSWQAGTSVDKGSLDKGGPYNGDANNNAGYAQPTIHQGNAIDQVAEYGAELGGPIIKDRLWVWGSYGHQQIDLRTIADVADKTELKTENVKFNAQLAANNSATLFGLQSEKTKLGRNAGPTRPQETTWDQDNYGDKPTAAKVEDTHIFNSNFYLTGLYSVVNGGFELVPEGGLNTTSFLDVFGVNHNTYVLSQTLRPQKQGKLDASSFFNTGNVSHELKFGAGYRKADVESLSEWGGAGHYIDSRYFGPTFPYGYLYVSRDAHPKANIKYTSGYAQDTMSVGNLTANVGVRYDRQKGTNEATSAPANPLFPDILPAVSYAGGDAGFTWTNVTPRLGLTYALGPERKTLLRASYSRFADQLGAATVFQNNPMVGLGYAYFYTNVNGTGNVGRNNLVDLNGNGVIDAGDVAGVGFGSFVNPFTHGLLNSNAVSANLSAPLTDEVLLSVEHALLPEFVVGLNLTYRKLTNLQKADLLIFDGNPYSAENVQNVGRVATRADYVEVIQPENPARPNILPNGQHYQVIYYELKPGLASRGGTYLHNTDQEQEYKGASITFNKRLANRWMLRGNFTWADWTWSKVPEDSIVDPTHFLGEVNGFQEGDIVMQGSGTGSGAKGGVYINSKWSYSLNGLYQIAPDRPWGFNAALNLTGRQGYPLPYYVRIGNAVRQGIPGFTRVQVTEDSDSFRLDDIRVLDGRLEKEFTFSDFGFTVSADCFNIFNEGFVQQRQHRLKVGPNVNSPLSPLSNWVSEVTSPRIFRLGARFSFR